MRSKREVQIAKDRNLIALVEAYRLQGLTFREIAARMNKKTSALYNTYNAAKVRAAK